MKVHIELKHKYYLPYIKKFAYIKYRVHVISISYSSFPKTTYV